MNKRLELIFMALILFSISSHRVLANTSFCSNPNTIVPIVDLNLVAAIKAELDVSTITCQDILRLKELTAREVNISSLEGLEHATNLEELNLSRNQISDLNALTNIPNLKVFTVWGNKIESIQPLVNLQKLARLNISSNQLTDLSPLGNMQNLEFVQVNRNQLTDISVLATLPNLKLVHLKDNQISDISPLVTNTNFGLRERSVVYLEDNCLTPEDANALTELVNRGIRVTHEPQKDCQ